MAKASVEGGGERAHAAAHDADDRGKPVSPAAIRQAFADKHRPPVKPTFGAAGSTRGDAKSVRPTRFSQRGHNVTCCKLALAPIVLAALSLTCLAQENISEVIFVAYELHLQEKSGIGLESWHAINGKKNFAVAVTTSCETCIVGQVYFGRESFGAGFWTTGMIDKRVGERWWVSFRGPAGYDICSASLDPERDIFLIKGGSTTGSLLRNSRTGENWISSVNYAPRNGGGHGVNVRFIGKYVPSGTEGAHHCAPTGTRVRETRQ